MPSAHRVSAPGIGEGVTVAILLLALAGAIGLALGRLPVRSLWLLASGAAYLVIVSGGHEAYSRFRVPVTPLLAVLGAAAVPMWRRRRAVDPAAAG